MKLTKAKLIRYTIQQLEGSGYRYFKDTVTPAQGLYIKTVGEGLYLSLGLTIHRYYDYKFTGTYYLSRSTAWGSCWNDMPVNSYKRVGAFLQAEERVWLLDEEHSRVGIDAWWDIEEDRSKALSAFVEAVRLTEIRFINQGGLVEDIEKSRSVVSMARSGELTISLVDQGNFPLEGYKYMPTKSIDDIPLAWFMAAELVIIQEGGILNVNTVKRLAADAFRRQRLRG